MNISEAIYQRKSIRAFKPAPVPKESLEEILRRAAQAPSWANTQPWEFAVATGKPLQEIQQGFLQKGTISPAPDIARPPAFPPRYAERIRELDRLNRLNTPADWDTRRVQNFRNFGAPAVIYLLTAREFYYQSKGLDVWALYDCGAVTENIMLLALSYDLGTIVQAQAVAYPDILRQVLKIPDTRIFVLGIAIGFPDSNNPVNQFKTGREPLENIVSWHGFGGI